MDDYHFAPWVNQLVASSLRVIGTLFGERACSTDLAKSSYGWLPFCPLGEPACSTDLAKSSYGWLPFWLHKINWKNKIKLGTSSRDAGFTPGLLEPLNITTVQNPHHRFWAKWAFLLFLYLLCVFCMCVCVQFCGIWESLGHDPSMLHLLFASLLVLLVWLLHKLQNILLENLMLFALDWSSIYSSQRLSLFSLSTLCVFLLCFVSFFFFFFFFFFLWV
jgi:hypothetical protein